MRLLAICSLALALVGMAASGARADETPEGSVVLAKSAPAALLVWDATPALAALVRAHATHAEALAALESDAMRVAYGRSAALADAKTVEVRVLYEMTGDVNPAYRTATFAGIERLLSVSAQRADVVAHGQSYVRQLAAGTVPPDVTVSIVGKLPPPQ